MNYIRFLKFLKNDFETSNKKFKSVGYFRSDLVLILIWFFVLEKFFSKKKSSVEDLMSYIPRSIASRPTVYKFINQSCLKKHLFKIADDKDKRKFNLQPSQLTIKEFELWSSGFRGF